MSPNSRRNIQGIFFADIIPVIAKKICNNNRSNSQSCYWFHGAYQYLRTLDLVSTPELHYDFYSREISTSLNSKPKNILICGTADHTILKYVAEAVVQNSPYSTVTVLDICKTPLEVCSRFAKTIGFPIIVQHSDATKTKCKDNYYNIIVTDGFLTMFENNDKRKLIAEWERILGKPGKVITTARIKNGVSRKVIVTKGQMETFVRRAVNKARLKGFSSIDLITIRNLAKDYARNMKMWPFTNKKEIKNLFANWDVQIEVTDVKCEFTAAKYVQIVASQT